MNLIVAVDQNWAIGYREQLLFPIPEDLKRFKALTTGHPVILGRKTLGTFPGGRPLPGRRNLILSTRPDYAVPGGEIFPCLDALLRDCPPDAFVIGGERVYRALLPHCDTAYVTKIFSAFPADAWFPVLDDAPGWSVSAAHPLQHHKGIPFQYVTYRQDR